MTAYSRATHAVNELTRAEKRRLISQLLTWLSENQVDADDLPATLEQLVQSSVQAAADHDLARRRMVALQLAAVAFAARSQEPHAVRVGLQFEGWGTADLDPFDPPFLGADGEWHLFPLALDVATSSFEPEDVLNDEQHGPYIDVTEALNGLATAI